MGRMGDPVILLVQQIPLQAQGFMEIDMAHFFVRVTHLYGHFKNHLVQKTKGLVLSEFTRNL